ncbi:DUF4279 domain-containing protein [Myroides odoratimimus]|uniref:Uncharacterized protein n=3 Tax=Myroides odoratimimus TaxID=76832 RepID=A0A0S7E695_9FLAO|nr:MULTISPECIES: DUF4279 domain-containing protein [Myroides]AJA68733.1 Protein of unknown function DUF4279 [Myroides sp. A21]ALU25995.1 hypothetical protein AS202_07490 [Myroides odoratimimus]EHO11112.1 hypothetical protein HMPREF9712_00769 [Myroides odoratimimus CCUG 10230]EHO14247.1 hypothetical protein HMPREF9714_00509 [Myroides odoratimimus CCUG 12901]MCA4792570.1 DUF4279 domain-containing protein [Myroides odoratimimus]
MTNFRLIYSIFGDNWNPRELTKAIGIIPTAYWKKGDRIDKYHPNVVLRKETNWEYSFRKTNTLLSEDVTEQFVELFSSKVDIIVKYINDNNLTSKLFIIPEIFPNQVPGIFFDKRLLNLLVKLNAEIDIDLYVINE